MECGVGGDEDGNQEATTYTRDGLSLLYLLIVAVDYHDDLRVVGHLGCCCWT